MTFFQFNDDDDPVFHGKAICRICGVTVSECACTDHKKETSYDVCAPCAAARGEGKPFSVRLYGNFLTNGSFGRVSRGLKEGLEDLGLLAGCVEVDSSCADEIEMAPGGDATIGIYAGSPAFVMVMTSHGVHEKNYCVIAPNSTWLPEKLITSVQRHAAIVAPSSWGAEVLSKYTGELLPPLRHGVSKGFAPDVALGAALVDGFEAGQFRVLHLSSTDKERKGTRELIKAWRFLVAAGELGDQPYLELVVDAQKGAYPEAEGEPTIGIRFRRINATVEQMAALYQQFHVVCQPSRGEGFGLAPLEARACGVPVVATDCTGHADHLSFRGDDDEYAGVIVIGTGELEPIDDGPDAMAPSLDVADIYDELRYAYFNWNTLYDNAREHAGRVRSEWSWANQTKLWLEAMAKGIPSQNSLSDQVEVAVMTCPREPVYVTSLLDKMFEREDMSGVRVRVVVDHHDAGYLGGWATDPRIEVELLSAASEEPLGHQHRVLRTFRRCLDGAKRDRALVVLQDDAVVAQNWLSRSCHGLDEAKKTAAGQELFLALYTTADYAPGGVAYRMDASYFHGTVGVLLPASLLQPLSERAANVDPMTPDDMMLKRYAIDNKVLVYNLFPSVVQHIGDKSARLMTDDAIMRSPTYRG